MRFKPVLLAFLAFFCFAILVTAEENTTIVTNLERQVVTLTSFTTFTPPASTTHISGTEEVFEGASTTFTTIILSTPTRSSSKPATSAVTTSPLASSELATLSTGASQASDTASSSADLSGSATFVLSSSSFTDSKAATEITSWASSQADSSGPHTLASTLTSKSLTGSSSTTSSATSTSTWTLADYWYDDTLNRNQLIILIVLPLFVGLFFGAIFLYEVHKCCMKGDGRYKKFFSRRRAAGRQTAVDSLNGVLQRDIELQSVHQAAIESQPVNQGTRTWSQAFGPNIKAIFLDIPRLFGIHHPNSGTQGDLENGAATGPPPRPSRMYDPRLPLQTQPEVFELEAFGSSTMPPAIPERSPLRPQSPEPQTPINGTHELPEHRLSKRKGKEVLRESYERRSSVNNTSDNLSYGSPASETVIPATPVTNLVNTANSSPADVPAAELLDAVTAEVALANRPTSPALSDDQTFPQPVFAPAVRPTTSLPEALNPTQVHRDLALDYLEGRMPLANEDPSDITRRMDHPNERDQHYAQQIALARQSSGSQEGAIDQEEIISPFAFEEAADGVDGRESTGTVVIHGTNITVMEPDNGAGGYI